MLCFALKKTRASGRNVGKVFNPVVKLVLENQPFLMPEPAEKPSLQIDTELTSYISLHKQGMHSERTHLSRRHLTVIHCRPELP